MSDTNGQGNENEVLDLSYLTQDYLAGVTPAGGGTQRELIKWGHVRLRIHNVEKQTANSGKHVMSKVTYEILDHSTDEDAVGKEVTQLYAGSKESPRYMQQRFAQLLAAADVRPSPGRGINPKTDLLGREIDACVILEQSQKTAINDLTGEQEHFVNNTVCQERRVGSPLPADFDPEVASRKGIRIAERRGMLPGSGASGGETPPWSDEQAPAGNVESQWQDEVKAPPLVHAHRAHIQLGTAEAATKRQELADAGWNPEGPLDEKLLAESGDPVVALWKQSRTPAGAPAGKPALAPKGANGGLAPVGQKPRVGTRAPRT